MAALGDVFFAASTGVFDSAAAFLLSSRPPKQIVVNCHEGDVEVSPGSAYVVARFNGATDATSAFRRGLRLAQAGLDLISIRGDGDLVTRRTFEEGLLAWRRNSAQVAQIRSMTTMTFTVGAVNLIVRDAQGRIEPAPPNATQHHAAFRYFRLSQVSDDLHEAFRNMYLCFEMLLSSQVAPMRHEKETDWLKRALAAVHSSIGLPGPSANKSADPVEEIFNAVYAAARLPLFHAKVGRNVMEPQASAEERATIARSLEILTALVLSIADKWFGARRQGGFVFTGWVYENLRATFQSGRILAMNDTEPFDREQKDLSSERYARAVAFRTETQDDDVDHRILVLWGEVSVSSLWQGSLQKIEVVSEATPLLGHLLESPLSLEGLDVIEYRDVANVENARQPKRRFEQ